MARPNLKHFTPAYSHWFGQALKLLLVFALLATSPCTCLSENSPIKQNLHPAKNQSSNIALAARAKEITAGKMTGHCHHQQNSPEQQTKLGVQDKQTQKAADGCGGDCDCAHHENMALQTYNSEAVKIANTEPAPAPIFFALSSLLTPHALITWTVPQTVSANSSPPLIKQHITTRGLGHWLI